MAEEEEVVMAPPPEEAPAPASVAQSEAQDSPPEPPVLWTHPEHVWSVLFATFCKVVGTVLTQMVKFGAMPWLDQEENTHALDTAMCDSNGYCMLKEDFKASGLEDDGYVDMIKLVVDIAVFVDGYLLMTFIFFWLVYLLCGNCTNWLIRMLNTAKLEFALLPFTKKVAGWMLVMNQSMITKTYSWGTHEKDRMYTSKYPQLLKLQTLPQSLLFFAFCLDIVCFCFLLVAMDPGLPGMSHRQRLAMEEDARLRMESLEAKILGNRKSYAPDNQTEHKEHLERIASSVSQKAVG